MRLCDCPGCANDDHLVVVLLLQKSRENAQKDRVSSTTKTDSVSI